MCKIIAHVCCPYQPDQPGRRYSSRPRCRRCSRRRSAKGKRARPLRLRRLKQAGCSKVVFFRVSALAGRGVPEICAVASAAWGHRGFRQRREQAPRTERVRDNPFV
jgi:hypothetical protein